MRSLGPKLTQKDMILSCEQLKSSLQESLNEDAKRVNEDSAKKRAVLQDIIFLSKYFIYYFTLRFDYEKFRQMVLGANIFPIKSKEVTTLFEGNDKRGLIFNSGMSQMFLAQNKTNEQQQQQLDVESIVASLPSELSCKNFREFRKLFDQNYSKEINDSVAFKIVEILKAQEFKYISIIFALDFEKYLTGFLLIAKYCNTNQNLSFSLWDLQNVFVFNILKTYYNLLELIDIKDFRMIVPSFLAKKEKEQLMNFYERINEFLNQNSQENKLNESFENYLKESSLNIQSFNNTTFDKIVQNINEIMIIQKK